MYLQRIHGLIAEFQRRHQAKEIKELDATPSNYSWRPFQLAFLLLNLESVTNLKHKDRCG